MNHPVRHAARRRGPVGGAGADTKNHPERRTSLETPHAHETAWQGHNPTFRWDHRTPVGAGRVHFREPPRTIPAARRKFPITHPAFLEEPLSRLLERR